jgi:hypothetical protein
MRAQSSFWCHIAAIDPPCLRNSAKFGQTLPALEELIAGSIQGRATTDRRLLNPLI